ncbi:MAG: 5-formyltetrahydrofolate cyclo-ligase [Oscillospiraceae bacterium]|nr:5-formyltetrahydrofolate cyclo-ligase [Oscillospiraceae bacterium]MBQ6493013.1 5-formyltetrahydrofolate cyclo-ligase [Erysipelotrichaceae bacterium]
MDKKQLRKICLEKRKELGAAKRQEYSHLICEKLLPYLKERTVMSYSPIRDEVDVSEINSLFDVYLPLTLPESHMEAVKATDERYVINRLGIKEPDPQYGIRIDKNELDVIIVPLVGFDDKRNRLGHGGGYYDRFLKDCKALKIGVAFAAQKLDQVPADENDVALDMIITEKEVL